MYLNRFLTYDLQRMAPKGLYAVEQALPDNWGQLNIQAEIPDETTMLFVSLGIFNTGIQVAGVIPVNGRLLAGKQLAVSTQSMRSLGLYAVDALEQLIQQINQGINNNAGLAPTTAYKHNDVLYQWTLLSLEQI